MVETQLCKQRGTSDTFVKKKWKTSAVSTTIWMVETQLCKLRGTSDAFVKYGFCEYYKWNIEWARPTNICDVPRSLQSWVSTIQSVVLTADVFQLFKKNNFSARIRISELWNPAAAGVRQCNTNNPYCSRLPGCQVSGVRTNIKQRITSLDININTSTRSVTC